MEYTTLGKTGRKVSRIGFGGTTAGIKNYTGSFDPANETDREQVIRTMRLAYELGVNYFDTAAAYGDGASEEIFGEALEVLPEDELFLATKVRIGTYDETRQAIEDGLRRLRRSRVDLIQIHSSHMRAETADQILQKGGMLNALEQAKSEGLTRHIGFSIECQNPSLYRLIESDRFDTIQMEYNFLFQHPYDPFFKSGSLYDAEARGMGIMAMRTATSGIFQEWLKQVNPENNFNYTPALIQFVLSNPLVDVALLGMRDEAILRENVRLSDDRSGRIDLEALHLRTRP